MHETRPTTPDAQPSFDTLRDIVPEFPLASDECLVVRGTPDTDHVLIPAGISPSKTAQYDVTVKAFKILGTTDCGPRIDADPLFTRSMNITTLTELIHSESVIEKRDYEVNTGVHGTLYFDGASRGNPGPAATGYALDIGDTTIEDGRTLGEQTNNYAEYQALLDGIHTAREEGVTSLTIYGDSELIIKQVTGEYSCNASSLKPALHDVHDALDAFDDWTIKHVPRSKNNTADGIANDVLDAA